jgi:multidrug resistance efflux pump
MPQDLKARPEDSYIKSVWNGQVSQFESRRAALEGQRSVIREKINQLGSQIVGAEAQVKAFTDQISSIRAEAKDIAPLVERGLIARPRILQLERTAFGLEGQIADAKANIAKAMPTPRSAATTPAAVGSHGSKVASGHSRKCAQWRKRISETPLIAACAFGC